MLTGEQVLNLVEAGFSADEIRSYTSFSPPNGDPDDVPPSASPDHQEEVESSSEAEPEQPSNDTVTRTEFDEMKTALTELTKAIKANNILHASKDTPQKTLTAEEAADAAIRAFFNA